MTSSPVSLTPGPDSAAARSHRLGGWLDGILGMLIFSASLPATRLAVRDLDPVFVTVARAAFAGLLAVGLLSLRRSPWPPRRDLVGLLIVSGGVVLGFPLLTALALRHAMSSHATVFLGLLPLSTALFAVVRVGERPPLLFWVFALAGAGLTAGYALMRSATAGGEALTSDMLMLAAILVCGLGYAEGGRLSRHLGGLEVIAWALILALPVMLPLVWLLRPHTLAGVGWPSLAGLAYVSVFSMLVGFIFWYRGLAHGGVAAVGQLQLIQPFFALVLAALLLGDSVELNAGLIIVAVVACVAGARHVGVRPVPKPILHPQESLP